MIMTRSSVFYGLVLCFLLGLSITREASAQTEVSGIIDTDTTWKVAGGPYIVKGNILIQNGATLTIEPGVEVRFDGAYSIQIEGEFKAQGTPTKRIVFTSNKSNPQLDDWRYLWFRPTSVDAITDANNRYISGSILSYAEISYGGPISVEYSSPFISNNYIHHLNGVAAVGSSGGAVWLCFSESTVIHNIIEQNGESGITMSGSNAKIFHNVIRNNNADRGGGMFLANCPRSGKDPIVNSTIANNVFVDNKGGLGGGIAFYGPEADTYAIEHNAFVNNSISTSRGGIIHTEGPGSLTVKHNTLVNNHSFATFHLPHVRPSFLIQKNNLHNTDAQYEVFLSQVDRSSNIDATDSYWGTQDSTVIDARIHDYKDDFNLGTVNYNPFVTSPHTDSPIAPPVGLVIAQAGSESLTIQWQANQESDVAGYRVYWDTDGYPYRNVVDVGKTTVYELRGLTPSTTYHIGVTAYDNQYSSTRNDADTIVNENQTNGNESWYSMATAELSSPKSEPSPPKESDNRNTSDVPTGEPSSTNSSTEGSGAVGVPNVNATLPETSVPGTASRTESNILAAYGCNFSTLNRDETTVQVRELFTQNSNTDSYIKSVVEEYKTYFRRDPRCDELQFHLDHSTPLDRLTAWLAENRAIKEAVESQVAEIVFEQSGDQLKLKVATKPVIAQDKQITFSGKTTPNALVILIITSEPFIATTTSDREGNWSYTLPGPLEIGEHTVKVSIQDTDGNKVAESEAIPLTVVSATQTGAPTAISSARGAIKGLWLAVIAGVILGLLYALFKIMKPKGR